MFIIIQTCNLITPWWSWHFYLNKKKYDIKRRTVRYPRNDLCNLNFSGITWPLADSSSLTSDYLQSNADLTAKAWRVWFGKLWLQCSAMLRICSAAEPWEFWITFTAPTVKTRQLHSAHPEHFTVNRAYTSQWTV